VEVRNLSVNGYFGLTPICVRLGWRRHKSGNKMAFRNVQYVSRDEISLDHVQIKYLTADGGMPIGRGVSDLLSGRIIYMMSKSFHKICHRISIFLKKTFQCFVKWKCFNS